MSMDDRWWTRWFSRPVATVTIDRPVPPIGQRVDLHGRLFGSWVGGAPQLLVQAQDRRWYLQEAPVVRGSHWIASVVLGTPGAIGSAYTVLAVLAPRLKIDRLEA